MAGCNSNQKLTMKTITYKNETLTITAENLRIAKMLQSDKVCSASDLFIPAYGSYKSKYAKRLNGSTPFSEEDEVKRIKHNYERYPKYVHNWIKKNPFVRKVCWCSKPRLLKKVLEIPQ